jgi:hypothetical protein
LSLATLAMGQGRLALASCVVAFSAENRKSTFPENAPPAKEARLYHRFPASNMPRKNKFPGVLDYSLRLGVRARVARLLLS